MRESKTFIGSTHKAEQVLFSMFPSILSFNFDTILFFYLLGSNCFFWEVGYNSQTVFGSTHMDKF